MLTSDGLVRKVLACPNLPTLPGVAIEVLQLARDPEVDMRRMAKVISRDSALTGKILKTVNSVIYALRYPVATVSRAVIVLGTRGVRTLTLGFSLANAIQKADTTSFGLRTYWQRSVYSAVAARLLAGEIGLAQGEEAFIGALLQDVGMLGIHAVLGDEYDAIHKRAADHEHLPEVERELLEIDHAAVGGKMAEHWSLPPLLAMPIACHHCPEEAPDEVVEVAEVVYAARQVAEVFLGEQTTAAALKARDVVEELFGMNGERLNGLLKAVSESVHQTATLFQVEIGAPVDNEAILTQAQDALVELALGAQFEAIQLREQNRELETAAKTDGLTGLYARSHLEDVLPQWFQHARARKADLAVMFLDADHFKQVNDTYGHAAGDEALRRIARLAAEAAGGQAFRYGGEEIVCVLRDVDLLAAANKAEELRKAVEAETIEFEGHHVAVTISVGLAVMEKGEGFGSPGELLAAADEAVYAAKHGGRNTLRIQAPQLR